MSQDPLQFIVGGIIISTYTTKTMTRLATGQMQEETQQLLDEYNELYNWEYNDMCDFIENYGETEFLTYYETYHRLVDDYGQNLIDGFAEHYDVDSVEHFEEMYQGQFTSGGEFAEVIASDCGYVSRDMPSWIEIDWQKTWDNALSYDYTQIGYAIFNDSY